MLFKHKYLTNLTISDSGDIIQVSTDLEISLDNNIPQTNSSNKSIKKLMEIFKMEANHCKDPVSLQRFMDNRVLTHRLQKDPEPVPALGVEYV